MTSIICFIRSRGAIGCCSILLMSFSMFSLLFLTKFSIHSQRTHHSHLISINRTKSLNTLIASVLKNDAVNNKNDKMKNLFKYRTTQTKEISLWFVRLILSQNKFKSCAQNSCFLISRANIIVFYDYMTFW